MMFDYIKGQVIANENNYIVIDNNGLGYKIFVGNPFAFEPNTEVIVYLYNHIRENEFSLYGFKSLDEKKLFLKLINVKGLGPKMAMPMLATGSINGIMDAIERENILYLTKFPKIGEKLARQIILDLKGKLIKQEEISLSTNDELVSVLESLGYKAIDIKKIIPKVDSSLKIEEQVKEALRLIMK